ncbi:MAG: hypothetical protein ACYDHH_08105 [Solirubrobacteraceae bacterium]
MNGKKNKQALGAVVAVAQAVRTFKDVRELVDQTLSAAQKYWVVLPVFAAGWAFMVSDDEHFAVFENIVGGLLDKLPIEEPLERLIAA